MQHFHEAVETERVQQDLVRFVTLGAALVEEEFDLVAREVTLTLGDICNALCSEFDQLYPDLSLDQSLALGLFAYNLLMGYVFAFVRFAQELDENIFEEPTKQLVIEPQMIVPHIHAYINQVAAGTPVFAADGSATSHQTVLRENTTTRKGNRQAMSEFLYKVGSFAARRAWAVIGIWALVIALAGGAYASLRAI